MAKAHPAPITFNSDAALWLTDYLLSLDNDQAPFDWPDPALLLLDTLEKSGWGLSGKPEEQARILWLQTILDAGVDSFVLTASIWEHLQNKVWLTDPDYYRDYWQDAKKEASHFVREQLGHRYHSALANDLPRSFLSLGLHFSSRVLNLVPSNGHPASAKVAFADILTTEGEWKERNQSSGTQPLDMDMEPHDSRLFPGMGPKKSSLFLLRLAKAGICEMPDIHSVGIPPDVHAVVMSFCTGIMDFDLPVSRGRAVTHLHDFWSKICEQYLLDNTELYWKMWLWGRRFCRPINCAICPLRQEHTERTRGRISTGSYYSDSGGRWLDPYRIASAQAALDLGAKFWLQYAPESTIPGIRVTANTVQFARQELDIQLTLDEAFASPASTTEEDSGDPFDN